MSLEANSRAPLREIIKEKPLLILFGLLLLYFSPVIFLGQTFFYRDLYLIHFPQKKLLVELIHSHKLPLWDPYLHGGQPFLADPVNNVLYPTNLLYFLMPLVTAFNFDLVFHSLLACFSTYALARVLGLRQAASFSAAIIFCFSGFSLSLMNHFIRYFAFCLFPLVILFWNLYLLEWKRKWFVWSLVALAAQLLTGSIEFFLMTLVFVFFWTLLQARVESRIAAMKKLVLLFLFAVGICAVQILPAMEMIRYSSRAIERSYASFSLWSLHPKRLPEIIIPNFLGRTDTLAAQDYWGSQIEDRSFPYILSVYLGCLTLLLALRGSRANGVLPRNLRLFLIAGFSLSLIFSLGRFIPITTLLYHLPFLGRLRYPIKFLAFGILPVALLAASCIDRDFEDEERPSQTVVLLMWTIALLLLASFFLFHFSVFGSRFNLFFFGEDRDSIRQMLILSLRSVLILWVIGAMIYQYRRRKPNRLQRWLFASVLVVDFFSAGKNVNVSAPSDFFTQTPMLARYIQANIGDARFFHPETEEKVVLKAPANDILWQYRWNLEMLNFYTAHLYGIRTIFHTDFDGLEQLRVGDLTRIVYSLPLLQALPLLKAASVKFFVTSHSITSPDIRFLSEIRNRSNKLFYLYEIPSVSDRVRFVTEAVTTRSPIEQVKTMIRPGFDPDKTVVLEHAASVSCSKNQAKLERLEESSDSLLLRVQSGCPGYLVFSDPAFPGWYVKVNGINEPTQVANFAFSAVFIPAGTNMVTKIYRPTSVLAGLIVTLVFGVIVFVVFQKYL